jgi:hypothetical protein
MRDTFCGQIQRARASYFSPVLPNQNTTKPTTQGIKQMQCQEHEIRFCQRFELFPKRTLFGSCGFFVSAHKIIRSEKDDLIFGQRGADARKKWTELFASYRAKFPALATGMDQM